MIRTSSYVSLCLCLSSFKLLFLKSYVSTDFDVHRNWMAIVYNLNLRDWYFDSTSEWTLDYPPLFAVFELLLAAVAHALQLDDALALSANPIRSESVIAFQRVTVIASDLVYYYGVYKLCHSLRALFVGPLVGAQRPAQPVPGPPTLLRPAQPGGAATSLSNSSLESSSMADQRKRDDGTGNGPAATAAVTDDNTGLKSRGKPMQVKARVKSINSLTSKQSAAGGQQQLQLQQQQTLSDAIYRPDATSCMALLLLLQPGLLLVDHVHFQYNGLLSGLLLLSVAHTMRAQFMAASFWFAVLLNMKHIYLYCAPAFGMYLLASFCLAKAGKQHRLWTFIVRAGRLGSVVLLVFLITYAPFGDQETLEQILKRLFPFKRGLTHAYWAPNAWSIYNSLDKILATIYKDSLRVTFDLESIRKTRTMIKSTSGRVGEFEHQYLPVIKPVTTFVLVGVLILPIVAKFLLRLNRKSPRLFMKGLTLTAFISFMFGWHVHEKAIILVLLPMVPISFTDPHLRAAFLRLTLAGTYSLFPLVYQPAEYPVKLTLLVAYYCYARSQQPPLGGSAEVRGTRAAYKQMSAHQVQAPNPSLLKRLLSQCYRNIDFAYILVLILNETYFTLAFGRLNYAWNPLAKLNRFAFLPLMLTSTLSALGISVSFLELYYDFVVCPDELVEALA